MDLLAESVQTIKGIGPKNAKLLAQLGIYTLGDALYLFPRDYEKYGSVTSIASMQRNQKVSLCVKFQGKPQNIRKGKNKSILRWQAKDNTGTQGCVCLINPIANQYKEDISLYMAKQLWDTASPDSNPQVEEYGPETTWWVPIYPLVEGLTQNDQEIL